MKCEICKKREATCIHHKDENRKNNDESNLQMLCVICHSKLHGISHKEGELRRQVVLYTKTVKTRNAIESQLRSFSFLELAIPEYLTEIVKELNSNLKLYAKEMGRLLDNGDFKIWNWLKEVKGISTLLGAKLISSINIEKTPNISSLWRYSGQAVIDGKAERPTRGRKIGYSPELKAYVWQIGESFIKQKTPIYKKIYDEEKKKQLKIVKTKMHAHNRAKRKAVKIFLSHLWMEWRKVEGLEITEPYVYAILKHSKKIKPKKKKSK